MAATSDDAEFEDEMKEILRTLGLEHAWPNFKENRVGPKEVDILATDEFQMLGVETIGDRARLKQMCKDVLKDDVCDITEKQLLAFWTGSSEVPLFGFPKMLEVNFVEGKNRLPVAHTCDMNLELPRGLSPEELEEKTIKAVQWGGQFHLA